MVFRIIRMRPSAHLVVYGRPPLKCPALTPEPMYSLVGLIFFASYAISTVTGFGAAALGLPFLVVGMVGGEYIHRRANARTFPIAVHLTLLVTGSLLLWTATH